MSKPIRDYLDSDGILHIVFDRPGEKVNTLSADVLRDLNELLQVAQRRDDVKALLFASDKPGMFIAGADVDEIAEITDAHKGAEGARAGQEIFQQIEDMGKPSCVAINGPCVGGGLEMALACTFRIASDSAKVRIGLPEVQLGIIPGFGGTQRLPRLVGLPSSLDMIMTGKLLVAKKAKKIGLIDMICPDAYLRREAAELLKRSLKSGPEKIIDKLRAKPKAIERWMGSIGPLRSFVLDKARKKASEKASPEQYPAVFRSLEAIEAAFTQPLARGLDLEARIEGELIPTPTSKNLIWLFKSQTALKSPKSIKSVPRDVNSVGVLGAGIMGGGIAQLAADKGLPVRLKDINYDSILTAYQTAQKVWDFKLKRRHITRNTAMQKRMQIAPTLDYRGFERVDIVVEAVVENLNVKRKVLAEVEQVLDPRAVFASNTSSIPITDIASQARHPERVVGMHFFNPVHRMPLVEVIAGRESSPEAVATVHSLALKMGKVPVVVRDSPGFLVNRVLTLYLFEAMALLTEGVRMQAMDAAMEEFGMPMGPFKLMDQVGLDTAHHVGKVLQDAFGARIGLDDPMMGKMVEAKRLGAKNQRGFYKYRDKKATVPDNEVYALAGNPAVRDLPAEMLQERMILTMVNEAALCLEEGIAATPRDIDMAMVMGTGFPPFRGGLLRHADSVGIPIIVDRLARLADAHGERFRPAAALHEMVREQRRFYP